MKPITRFNQPQVLSEIGRDLLPELFDRFKNELATMNVSIPDPGLADGPYYDAVAELFNSCLPQALLKAVLAVEELADPANKDRLEQAFWDSPYELYIEPQASPEHTALRLWLHAPYTRAQGAQHGTPPSPPEVVCPVGEGATADSSASALSLVPQASTPVAPSDPTEAAAPRQPSEHSPAYIRRRTGKVACLPKATRERINEMISDGFTYAAIIKALGEEGKALNEMNISNWCQGGYKDWLAEQKDREETGLWEEYTLDLVKQNPVSALNEATVKMATVQIRKALRAIGHASLETNLKDNPESYIRLLNALSRLTVGALSCQTERAKAEQREAVAQRQKADPDSLCITAETLQKIEKLLHLR